jgi:hypothetical protein
MTLRLNDIFELPSAALAGDKRIPKTLLVQQAALTKHEQKVLDKAKRIEHFATVQKSTTRIQPYVDEDRDVQGIIFLHCEMAGGTQAFMELARLVHKCFPNPTVMVSEAGDHVCITVAITRKSHAEKGATVIEAVESTGAFALDDPAYAGLIEALVFDRLPQDSLWSYLQAFAWNVRLSRTVETLGFYPRCELGKRTQMNALIERFDNVRSELKTISDQRKDKDVSLNDSAKLRMEMKKLEKRQAEIVSEIKELCNG